MLSFYLSQVPLGPTCPPEQVWVVPASAPKPRVSYDPAASQDKPELGMSSVTAGNCQHPLLASASEVTPGDLGASSWKSVVLACPHLQLPPPGGPEQRPTSSLTLGLSGSSLGDEKLHRGSSPQAYWA